MADEAEEEEEALVTQDEIGSALYDFVADGEDELSVKEGEQLVILDKVSSEEWWKCRNFEGVEGVVPASYIEVRLIIFLLRLWSSSHHTRQAVDGVAASSLDEGDNGAQEQERVAQEEAEREEAERAAAEAEAQAAAAKARERADRERERRRQDADRKAAAAAATAEKERKEQEAREREDRAAREREAAKMRQAEVTK